ncbi:MAG TPA: tetratricopeptide repeat protein [Gemmatimonadaceae bacterium]|nr:tetratricopeptide repeat protein [Gemmatimonadaceae bacterium]
MRTLQSVLAGMLLVASVAGGQTAADHVALGDKEYLAMNASAALQHYEEALKIDPKNYEALWKASRSAVDLGSYDREEDKRETYFKSAEKYARDAVAANPGDAEGHFNLARALGKNALTQSPKSRIKYAKDVRSQALECLKIDPKHAGCLHVMGMWNAEVMRLNGFTRMLAKNFLGGQIFDSANWSEAKRYMEESVANEPDRIVHHVDLAGVYRDTGDKTKARAEWQAVMKLPNKDFNDRHYKAEADAGLRGD